MAKVDTPAAAHALPTRRSPRPSLQLPFDVLRAPHTGYERGTCARALACLPSRELTLAVVVAVTGRHTNQEELAFDVSDERGRIALDGPFAPDMTLAALVQQVRAGLTRGAESDGRATLCVHFGAVPLVEPARDESYDLALHVEAGPTLRLVAHYNAQLFRAPTVERFLRSLEQALGFAVAHPEAPAHALPLLGTDELRDIQVSWDSGSLGPLAEPAHVTFERFARTTPHAVAARFADEVLHYGELDARANRLAHHLRSLGVTRGSTVAVCVRPSFDVLVALLALFKLGAIYVPLDPTHPQALIAAILDEAAPRVVLTQRAVGDVTDAARFVHVHLDGDPATLAALPDTSPGVDVALTDGAYLLYTSGTTGRPKGVIASHANLAHYLRVARHTYGFAAADRFCSLARYTFSISMFELLSPLTCGGSLRLMVRDDVLAPERLAAALAEATVVHAGPSLLTSLFRYLRASGAHGGGFPAMRHASSGGDIVAPSVCEEMKRVFPHAELFVIYGSTEISCMGCTYPIARDVKVARSFVGKPFPDVTVRVTDPFGQPVPIGVVGEICFAGQGVVGGYLQRPELTREKFVEREGTRFYTMGDLGRLHADGHLEILGRRDYQVQVRGIRVELPGIENVVREVGLAAQCAVAVKRLDEHDVRLVAFVVAPRETALAPFRRALAQHLPDTMLPQALVVLEALPLTRNGKLDRAALDALPWRSSADEESKVAPRNPLEQRLAAAFAQALGRDEVGIDDDFFDLGGHSLLAVSVSEHIENTLGLTVSPALLFEHTTVRALAAHMGEEGTPHAIRLGPPSDKPALFLLLGVHIYRELARALGHAYSVYGVYSDSELGMLAPGETAPTVSELSREYVAIIRRTQPRGPYRLAGMSFGGIVAFEVAQELRRAGEEVRFLGLLDTVLPERGLLPRLEKLARLARLPSTQQRALFVGKLQNLVRRARGEERPAQFSRFHTLPTLADRERLREEAYHRATVRYLASMRPFEGPVLLAVAGQRLARDPLASPTCGFSRAAPALETHVLDADHLTLLESPAVLELATLFLRALAAGEAPARAQARRPFGELSQATPAISKA